MASIFATFGDKKTRKIITYFRQVKLLLAAEIAILKNDVTALTAQNIDSILIDLIALHR